MMVTMLNVITIIMIISKMITIMIIMMKMTITDLEDGVEPWIWFFQPRSKLFLPL